MLAVEIYSANNERIKNKINQGNSVQPSGPIPGKLAGF